MRINVIASHREGHPGVWTVNTLWPSGAPIPIEVLDVDESPAREIGEIKPDTKIGRAELAALRLQPHIIIQGTDQTNAVEMTARLAEANAKHAEAMAAKDATAAQLSLEIQRLRPFEAIAAEQEQTIAELRGRISRMGGANPGKQAEKRP